MLSPHCINWNNTAIVTFESVGWCAVGVKNLHDQLQVYMYFAIHIWLHLDFYLLGSFQSCRRRGEDWYDRIFERAEQYNSVVLM